MILTVTINPLLERRYIFPHVDYMKDNRGGKVQLTAGGKGINVSRQLNFLNIQNIALTFLGGNNGKLLKQILAEEKINFTSIKSESETRDASLIFSESDKSLSTFFGANSIILEKESEEFKLKLDKMIQNSEMVIFSGSSPSPETDSIFPFGIESANKHDKISICDTYGEHLKACIKAKPTVLHNNITEAEKSLNISLKNEKEILAYMDQLYDSGIKQSYITNGSLPFYASNFCYKYKIESPSVEEVDSTGSGDSFDAGIIYGLHNSLTFQETLSIAASLGAANAKKFETSNITITEISDLKSHVKISTIGKKIKTLDVP